jgi:hypothetical protein
VTPLQALSLLNAPEFHEAARALAARILQERAGGFTERLRHAYELCLGRPPAPEEVDTMSRYYHVKRERQPAGSEAAAWAGVAGILLNLDEFITRE